MMTVIVTQVSGNVFKEHLSGNILEILYIHKDDGLKKKMITN